MEDGATFARVRCAAAVSDQRRDVIELTLTYGMILAVIWTPRPWSDLLFAVVGLCIAAILVSNFRSLDEIGLRRGYPPPSLWATAAAASAAAISIAVAFALHTFHLPSTPTSLIGHTFGYAIWAAIQQLVLQCFFLARLLRVLKNPIHAAIVAAVLFSVAHLPSPVLTLITFVCGLAACLFYLRYRSLYPLFAAHAILGGAIAVSIPSQVDHEMRVGISYLNYSQDSDHPAHLDKMRSLSAHPLTHQPANVLAR
jgi:membrane protease YdiL (CAAX protease family)